MGTAGVRTDGGAGVATSGFVASWGGEDDGGAGGGKLGGALGGELGELAWEGAPMTPRSLDGAARAPCTGNDGAVGTAAGTGREDGAAPAPCAGGGGGVVERAGVAGAFGPAPRPPWGRAAGPPSVGAVDRGGGAGV